MAGVGVRCALAVLNILNILDILAASGSHYGKNNDQQQNDGSSCQKFSVRVWLFHDRFDKFLSANSFAGCEGGMPDGYMGRSVRQQGSSPVVMNYDLLFGILQILYMTRQSMGHRRHAPALSASQRPGAQVLCG